MKAFTTTLKKNASRLSSWVYSLSHFQLGSLLEIVNALLSPLSGPIDLEFLPRININLRNSENEWVRLNPPYTVL